MEYDFFTYEGIKYFVIYEKGEKIFYKYVDNKLEPLSDEELKIMKKTPENYVGVTESLEKFNEIKNKYTTLINYPNKKSNIA